MIFFKRKKRKVKKIPARAKEFERGKVTRMIERAPITKQT